MRPARPAGGDCSWYARALLTRNRYILQQREQHRRRAVAVLPVHYPKELLTALGLLAVELWGPPGPPRGDAAGRIQSYVCPVARNALAFLASGGADAVDGVLFPHTCDSLQGLATLAADFGGWGRPAFTFQHPKSLARPSAIAFLEAELRSLAAALEPLAGRSLDAAHLAAAVELHEEIDAARAALLAAGLRLAMSDRALYQVLRRGEWLWPEDHLGELQLALRSVHAEPVRGGIPVLVTGYVPEPGMLLEVLEAAGGYVAGDDYAAVGRRVAPRHAGPRGDPWKVLVERCASYPPCPTRSADSAARMRHLARLVEHHGARGAVLHLVKFCEPELFDVPALRGTFVRLGLPVLQLETELELELSAQTTTRIEAFVEMLSAGRAA